MELVADYVILGAGPVGLELGSLLGAAGRNYRILDSATGPGSSLRCLTRECARDVGAHVRYGVQVRRVSRHRFFELETQVGDLFRAKRLIVAGARGSSMAETVAGDWLDGSIFAEECRPRTEVQKGGPAYTSAWESVNVPDLFFATVPGCAGCDLAGRPGTSAEGRCNVRALARILGEKYEDESWPSLRMAARAEILEGAIARRTGTGSVLADQPGFLCDVVALCERGALYMEELPLHYAMDTAGDSAYFAITFEHDEDRSSLRRVVRYYEGSELVAEHRGAGCGDHGSLRDREPLRRFLFERLSSGGEARSQSA